MAIEHLRALVSEDFEAVNALIAEQIQSEIALIDDLAKHIVDSGGKRLRPLLVILASHACQYSGKNHIKLAAMLEFFHSATLLHDDVIDESTLRRGTKTAHTIWGSKASILVGDYLFTKYIQLMLDVGDLEIMRFVTKIAYQMGCGEIKQLSNRHQPDLNLEEYFAIIRDKTSLLFAAAASLGARIHHQPPAIEQALYHYGLHLGNAFQLIDDALDYCSDAKTLGKNIGDDLADGKATLPLIHVLKQGSQAQQIQVRESLKLGTLDFLPQILEAIQETQAIEFTRQIAQSEAQKAIEHLEILPESVYKNALINLACYAVERDH